MLQLDNKEGPMVMECKISISMLAQVAKHLKNLVPILLNYYHRPKVQVDIRSQVVETQEAGDVRCHHFYPCLLLSFEKDVKVDIGSIKLNNESFHIMLSRDPIYLRQNQNSSNPVSILNNRVMVFIHENWHTLTQKVCYLKILKQEQEVLTLYIKQGIANFLFSEKKKARVFGSKRKVVLSICIDGIQCEYGLSLVEFCKVIIGHLCSE